MFYNTDTRRTCASTAPSWQPPRRSTWSTASSTRTPSRWRNGPAPNAISSLRVAKRWRITARTCTHIPQLIKINSFFYIIIDKFEINIFWKKKTFFNFTSTWSPMLFIEAPTHQYTFYHTQLLTNPYYILLNSIVTKSHINNIHFGNNTIFRCLEQYFGGIPVL